VGVAPLPSNPVVPRVLHIITPNHLPSSWCPRPIILSIIVYPSSLSLHIFFLYLYTCDCSRPSLLPLPMLYTTFAYLDTPILRLSRGTV